MWKMPCSFDTDIFQKMLDGIFTEEYCIAYRSHTVGNVNMPIAPETLRSIYCDAYSEFHAITREKQDRLYSIIRKLHHHTCIDCHYSLIDSNELHCGFSSSVISFDGCCPYFIRSELPF